MLLLVELTTGADPEQVNNYYYLSPIIYKTALVVTLKITAAEKHTFMVAHVALHGPLVVYAPGLGLTIKLLYFTSSLRFS